MEQTNCERCGSPEAHVSSDGVVFSGAYGSAEFDLYNLVWLHPEAKADVGWFCDACVSEFVSEEKLETFSCAVDTSVGVGLSKEAYVALFKAGANEAREQCIAHIGTLSSVTTPSPETLEAAKGLATRTAKDDTFNGAFNTTPESKGELAIRAGRAHATALIAFGHGGRDVIDEIAAEWCDERIAKDRTRDILVDLMQQELEELEASSED